MAVIPKVSEIAGIRIWACRTCGSGHCGQCACACTYTGVNQPDVERRPIGISYEVGKPARAGN
jgi:hypothetical protein